MRERDWDVIATWAERAIMYSVRFWLIFTLTTSFAVVTFVLVYRAVIPTASHDVPVFFSFDGVSSPSAYVPLGPQIMSPGHVYAVTLFLEMPECGPNVDAGNFMVDISLSDAHEQVLAVSRRPAIMRYRSELLRWLSTAFFILSYVVGRSEELQWVPVHLFESFPNPSKAATGSAAIVLSRPELRIYSAHLRITALLEGLSYYMYNYRVSSFLLGVSALVFAQFLLIVLLQLSRRQTQAAGGESPTASPRGARGAGHHSPPAASPTSPASPNNAHPASEHSQDGAFGRAEGAARRRPSPNP